jgi:hypothetical protein
MPFGLSRYTLCSQRVDIWQSEENVICKGSAAKQVTLHPVKRGSLHIDLLGQTILLPLTVRWLPADRVVTLTHVATIPPLIRPLGHDKNAVRSTAKIVTPGQES